MFFFLGGGGTIIILRVRVRGVLLYILFCILKLLFGNWINSLLQNAKTSLHALVFFTLTISVICFTISCRESHNLIGANCMSLLCLLYAQSRFKTKSLNIRIQSFRLLRWGDKLTSGLTTESYLGCQLCNFKVHTSCVYGKRYSFTEYCYILMWASYSLYA